MRAVVLETTLKKAGLKGSSVGVKEVTTKRFLSWVVEALEGSLVIGVAGLGITGLITRSSKIAEVLLWIAGFSLLIAFFCLILHFTGWAKRLHISNPTNISVVSVGAVFGIISVAATIFVALIVGLPTISNLSNFSESLEKLLRGQEALLQHFGVPAP